MTGAVEGMLNLQVVRLSPRDNDSRRRCGKERRTHVERWKPCCLCRAHKMNAEQGEADPKESPIYATFL